MRPVAACIRCRTLMLVYKAKNEPVPVSSKACIMSCSAPRSLWTYSKALLARTDKEDKSRLFSVLAPRWWYELSLALWIAETHTFFKLRLKSYPPYQALAICLSIIYFFFKYHVVFHFILDSTLSLWPRMLLIKRVQRQWWHKYSNLSTATHKKNKISIRAQLHNICHNVKKIAIVTNTFYVDFYNVSHACMGHIISLRHHIDRSSPHGH